MAIWKRRAERQEGDPPAAAAQPERPVAATPRADFLDATAAMRASLGSDAVVNGRLSFTSPTRIDGTLRGEVRCSDLLVVGETGFVEGTIRATTLVLLGTLRGNILGAERVDLGPQAKVRGTIETRVLRVQEGAAIDGDCRVGPSRARVHVLARAAGGDATENLDETLGDGGEDPPTGSG